jgi:hypothetical protein
MPVIPLMQMQCLDIVPNLPADVGGIIVLNELYSPWAIHLFDIKTGQMSDVPR